MIFNAKPGAPPPLPDTEGRRGGDLLEEETQKIINISRILLTNLTTFLKTPCAPSLSAAIAVM